MSALLTPAPPAELTVVPPTCPLCHTLDRTVTSDTLRDGAAWSCTRCGQKWTAARLATAAAYAQYVAEHP